MPSWNQGDKYKPSETVEETTTPTAGTEEEATAEEPKRQGFFGKIDIRILLGVGAIIAVAVLIFLVAWQWYANKQHMDNPNNDPLEWVGQDDDPGNVDDFFDQFTPVFTYTPEELSSLRAWGYTSAEIEAAQLAETSAQTLINQSRQAQEEARAQLSNPESPEYLALLHQTWLGEPSKPDPKFVINQTQYSTDTVTLNADYEKVPVHGTNLFLKVELADGTHHFMECSPFRYGDLADSGNIVVVYDLITFDGQSYINNMREKEVQ